MSKSKALIAAAAIIAAALLAAYYLPTRTLAPPPATSTLATATTTTTTATTSPPLEQVEQELVDIDRTLAIRLVDITQQLTTIEAIAEQRTTLEAIAERLAAIQEIAELIGRVVGCSNMSYLMASHSGIDTYSTEYSTCLDTLTNNEQLTFTEISKQDND